MNHVLRKMTAFVSALSLTYSCFASGAVNLLSESGLAGAKAASAEKTEYYVRVEDNIYQYIRVDGKYCKFNTARLISANNTPETFIVPTVFDPEEGEPEWYRENYDEGRIFNLGTDCVDARGSSAVIIPDGIMNVEYEALKLDSAVRSVAISDSVIKLEDQSFAPDVIVRGHSGSIAEKYADKYENKFEYIGDLTNDGKIDSADVLLMNLYMNGGKELSEDEAARADETFDGGLDIRDFILIKNEILEPRNSVLGASVDGALAAPELKTFKRSDKKPEADGYMKFAANSAATVLLDTKDENGEKNTVYSPLSYYMALSMAAECASGTTQNEFTEALGAEDMDDLRKENASLFKSLYFDDYTAFCKIANSIWFNNKWKLEQDTLDTLADKYYAVVFGRDFSDPAVPDEISMWINKNTSGKFTPKIKVDPVLDIMKIINTVTFKETWSSKFGKASPDEFTLKDGSKITCDFMGYEADYKQVAFADKYMKCYEQMKDGFRMNFILPDEGVNIDDLIADSETINEIYGDEIKYETRKTVFSVPKFDVASKFDLIEAAKTIGIKSAFDKYNADFSGVIDYENNGIGGAVINEITHEAKVTIDEEGCEAAAYTLISMAATSAAPDPSEPVYFELDRPFFYYISDQNGTPLFAGIINDPLEKNQ
ncbi:MAG: hypothetical protein J6U36_06980 [Oscillospiraceae bacterium]|nr:hypothetical protein [Oscillospiraceae bacterium]